MFHPQLHTSPSSKHLSWQNDFRVYVHANTRLQGVKGRITLWKISLFYFNHLKFRYKCYPFYMKSWEIYQKSWKNYCFKGFWNILQVFIMTVMGKLIIFICLWKVDESILKTVLLFYSLYWGLIALFVNKYIFYF